MMTEPGLQMRQRRLDDPERRVDVGLHRRVEILGRDVEDRLARLLPGGVADHDVEAAEPSHRLARPACWQNASSRRSPGMATPLRPASLISAITSLRIRLLGRKIIDRDIGAFARIGDGGGAAHAGIAAGDQRLAAGEPAGALVAFLAVVRPRLHLAREARPGLGLLLERRLRIFVVRIAEFLIRHENFLWNGFRLILKECAFQAGDELQYLPMDQTFVWNEGYCEALVDTTKEIVMSKESCRRTIPDGKLIRGSHSQTHEPWKGNPEKEQRSGHEKVRSRQVAGNQYSLIVRRQLRRSCRIKSRTAIAVLRRR